MQQGTPVQAQDLARQIREQVRAQVQAAQAQARAAREQARQAEQQAGHAQQGVPAPPAPPTIEVPGNLEVPQVPGTSMPPFVFDPGMGARVEHIAIEFFVMVVAIFFVVPIARAFARRIDKKPVPTPLDKPLSEQLQRIENSVDSMAIEIERISEAQRYMARLQSDRSGGAALPPQQAAS